jgi:8-hydroxy-5-deazaflavin:NADPH oxidoreductase
MRIGVLGTGMVGRALATKLISLGHEVMMGSRRSGNETAVAWAEEGGQLAAEGDFAQAAAFGELVVNATAGSASLDALASAEAENLAGKVLLDVANVLDTEAGPPPIVGVSNRDSLAEQIQRTFPEARVVKSLNTVNAALMVDPSIIPGSHTMFVAGDEPGAKDTVKGILREFGWPDDDVMDLGGIVSARGMEMYVVMWTYLWQVTGTAQLNVKVVTP